MHRLVLGFLTLVVGFAISIGNKTNQSRLGCFEDSAERVWKQWDNHHEKNTVPFCRNMCQEFKYAGVQAGAQCMCGDEIPLIKLPDSRCSSFCTGDPEQTCGGGWALEIFHVDQKPVMLGRSLGCFQDAEDRVWKTGQIRLQSNSPQRCFNACRGFRYAGVEAGDWCSCGNTLPLTPLPLARCNIQCFGLTGKTCGGYWALDVFEISETTALWPMAIASTMAPKICPEAAPCPVCPTLAPAELPVQVNGCIPMDYQQHGDLGIYKLYSLRMIWDEAWQQCENDDAHLLIINSEDEAKFVRSLFAQVPSETRMHAGFHDLLRRGTYRTVFGESLSSTGYNVWSTRYPQTPSKVKHCGAVDVLAQLAQIDGNCDARAVFVCEKKSDSPDSTGRALDINLKGASADQGL